jgi:hypothetical protein
MTGQTKRVSISTGGQLANKDSYNLTISADGRFVAFNTRSNNLVLDDTNYWCPSGYCEGVDDVFVRDLQPDLVAVLQANNQDGPITVPVGSPLSVSLSLEPGSHTGEDGELYLYAQHPSGYAWYNGSGWVASDTPIAFYAGPLSSLPSMEVFSNPTITAGEHRFGFIVDLRLDGSIDKNLLYVKQTIVTAE